MIYFDNKLYYIHYYKILTALKKVYSIRLKIEVDIL